MTTQLELPTYEVNRSKDFSGFLIVWCPREDCPSYTERPFVVHSNTFLKKQLSSIATKDGKPIIIRGRPCPYCAKVSAVPKRVDIT